MPVQNLQGYTDDWAASGWDTEVMDDILREDAGRSLDLDLDLGDTQPSSQTQQDVQQAFLNSYQSWNGGSTGTVVDKTAEILASKKVRQPVLSRCKCSLAFHHGAA